jgi:hypothetical protein
MMCARVRPRESSDGQRREERTVLIALLLVLGVDLTTVLALAALVLGRRRWLKRQPGEFAGAIRVASGDLAGLKSKWRRGYGRWVRDVLVWTKAPLMFRNQLLPVDGLLVERQAQTAEVKRLGDKPVVVEFASGGARIEIASRAEDRAAVLGPRTTAG